MADEFVSRLIDYLQARQSDAIYSALLPVNNRISAVIANLTLAGDVTGLYTSTVVERIRGITVDATTPTVNQALVHNGTQWTPTTVLSSTTPSPVGSAAIGVATTYARADHSHAISASTITLAGDVTGAADANTVTKIRNRVVESAAPSDLDLLSWNATASEWQARSPTEMNVATVVGAASTLYVNTSTGNDSNDGLTDVTAKATLAGALALIPTIGGASTKPTTINVTGTLTETWDLSERRNAFITVIGYGNGANNAVRGAATGGSATTLTFSGTQPTGHFDGGKIWVTEGPSAGDVLAVISSVNSSGVQIITTAGFSATPTTATWFTCIGTHAYWDGTAVTSGRIITITGSNNQISVTGFQHINNVAGMDSVIQVTAGANANVRNGYFEASTSGVNVILIGSSANITGNCFALSGVTTTYGVGLQRVAAANARGNLVYHTTPGTGRGFEINNLSTNSPSSAAGSKNYFKNLAIGISVSSGGFHIAYSTTNTFSGCTVNYTGLQDGGTVAVGTAGVAAGDGAITATPTITSYAEATSGQGGKLTVYRADTSVTSGEVIGAIQFLTNDAQVTSNGVGARIRAIASAAYTTDAAPMDVVVETQSTTIGGTLNEVARFTNTQAVKVKGGNYKKVLAVTANTTATVSDSTILVTCSTANITVTLPTIATAYDSTLGVGLILNISKRDATGFTVIVDGSGSETINGALTQTISARYTTMTVQASATEWVIL